MTPDLLHSFLTAYEAGSIQKAAGTLHVSQPTLSRRLQRLEDILGTALFERSPTGLVPTIYGHALAQRARLIVMEMDLARDELARIRDAVGGFVTFGLSPGIAAGLMPTAAARLAASNPDLRLGIVEGVSESLIEQVRERRIDFAICTIPIQTSETLLVERIGEDPFAVVAGRHHPLADGRTVPLAETAAYPWAMPTFRGAVRQWVEAHFVSIGLSPPVPRIETSSMQLIRHLLADDRHLSYLPARLAGDFPDVVALPCRPSMVLSRAFGAVRLSHREPSPAALLVIEAIRQAAADPPPLTLSGLEESA